MGTSSSYGGPTGSNPLLPPWAQGDGEVGGGSGGGSAADDADSEGGDQDDVTETSEPGISSAPTVPTFTMVGAKSSMTRYVNRGGGSDRVGRVARNYVSARGGPRGSSRAATGGRTATARLGSFLSGVGNQGLAAAARTIGLMNLAGRSAAEVFAELATRIAPSGATLEEAAARRAINDALTSLYEKFNLEHQDLSRLDAMDADAVRDAIQVCIASYVFHRWLQELGDRIEENAIDPDQAYRLEREVRDYVQLAVQLDLADLDVMNLDWNGQQGRELMERLYQEAYSLLESK